MISKIAGLVFGILLGLIGPAYANVAADVIKAPVGATGFSCTSGTSFAAFMTVGASDTLLVVGVAIGDGPTAIGTITAVWDSGGTNQTMTAATSLVSTETGTNGNSAQLFAVVKPTAGSKTLKVTCSGGANGDGIAASGISVTGSVNSSVSAALEGANTISQVAGSATVSVTTSASIPSTDMATGIYVSDTVTVSSVNLTSIGITNTDVQTGSNYTTGSGATVTGTATLSGTSGNGAAGIVGIVAATITCPTSLALLGAGC